MRPTRKSRGNAIGPRIYRVKVYRHSTRTHSCCSTGKVCFVNLTQVRRGGGGGGGGGCYPEQVFSSIPQDLGERGEHDLLPYDTCTVEHSKRRENE